MIALRPVLRSGLVALAFAIALPPAPARGEVLPSFGPLPTGKPALALCQVGPDTLAVASADGIVVLSRGLTAPPPEPLPFGARHLASREVAGVRHLAAAGKQYLAVREGGAWRTLEHPRGLHFAGVALDGAGIAWGAAERGSLWSVGAAGLESVPYPSDEVRVRALASGPGGEMAVLGEDRALWWFDGKTFAESRALYSAPAYTGVALQAGWFDAEAKRLWVLAGAQELVAVAWRSHRIDERVPFSVGADAASLAGGPTERGKSLLVATSNHVYLHAARELGWTELSTSWSAVHAVLVDTAGGEIYAAHAQGVTRLEVPPPLVAHDDRDELDVLPRFGFRVIMGPLFHLTDRVPTPTVFDLELAASFRMTLRPRHAGSDMSGGALLAPEIGYVYDASGAAGSHFAHVGLAVGYDAMWWGLHWVPRFVVGSANGELALGARHGVLAEFIWGLLNVEVGHQMLVVDGALHHDVRLNFGVDLYVIVALVMVDRVFSIFD